MIGSHDSFTYLDARNKIINRFSRYWKCQDLSIVDQYKAGVRFFDIRVKCDVVNNARVWRCCHGYAEFSKIFFSLKAICNFFTITLKDCQFRIWLEKGSEEDWELFKTQALEVKDLYPGFLQAVRKSDEFILFRKDTHPKIVPYNAKMEKLTNILKGLFINPIKDWANKHNPEITQDMIDDPTKIYFMDFVKNHI